MTTITKHARDRTKERLNLPKRLTLDNAERALEKGITHKETRGSLHRYISYLYYQNGTANNVRIYCNNVYIFSGETLITVFPLPQKYRKTVGQILSKRSKGNDD